MKSCNAQGLSARVELGRNFSRCYSGAGRFRAELAEPQEGGIKPPLHGL
jgi:hypothetical protein